MSHDECDHCCGGGTQVGAIQLLSPFTSLRVLELGSNRIRAIEGLDALGKLQELWLGRNRIQQVGP